MGDFLITMDTGEQHLMHYGVKGMRWGEWNAETRARYANAGNSTYYKKAKRGSEYGQSVTNLRRAYNANQPKAKQVAKVALMGVGGAHAYNTARSRGLSRGDALTNAIAGPFYAQGVKRKQRKLETTDPMVSKAAKERGDYTKNESLLKTGAKTALIGVPGVNAYNTVKARTGSRGKAAVAGVGTSLATGLVGGANGIPLAAPVVYGLTGRKGYDKNVAASKFDIRKPGEKARNQVNQKVSKSILEEHQDASREFQKNRRKQKR